MSRDAVQRIASYGVVGYSGWVRDNCPFCLSRTGKEDRRKSLGVNVNDGFYVCHKCEVRGRVEIDTTFDSPAFLKVGDPRPEVEAIDGYIPLWMEPGLNAEVFADARCYLRGRGLGRAAWQQVKIGGVWQGYHKNRIVIPITKNPGDTEWCGWVARDWTGKALRKYMYPRGMNRAEIMFEGWRLFEESTEPLMIVEGVFDALPYYGHAVAVLGKPSYGQIEIMKKSKRTLVVVLDGDAWETGYALSQKLKLNSNKAGYVKLPAGEDPASVDHSWLKKAVEKTAREIDDNGNN